MSKAAVFGALEEPDVLAYCEQLLRDPMPDRVYSALIRCVLPQDSSRQPSGSCGPEPLLR